MSIAVEAYLDDQLSAIVRHVWAAIEDTGLPVPRRHAEARPHLTLHIGDDLVYFARNVRYPQYDAQITPPSGPPARRAR